MTTNQKKLNILYTCLRYPPAPGGAEEMVGQIVKGIRNKGSKVEVLTSNLRTHGGKPVRLESSIIQEDPVYVSRYFTVQLPEIPYPITPNMDFRLLSNNADIVHGFHFYFYPADAARAYSFLKRQPFIFTPFFYLDSRQALKWQIYRKTLGSLTMKADCVLAITELEKKLILENYPKVKRIEVIKPGINQQEFQKPRSKTEARKLLRSLLRNKLHNTSKIIMFAGRVCTGKGIDLLIQAAPSIVEKYPDTIFLIVGEDFTGEVKKFKKQIASLDLEKNFSFTGNLMRQDLVTAYQASDIFVLPSRYEAFGIVLAEAMAAGLPIVATNYSAIPEVVKNQETGLLFELDNHQDLSAKIMELLGNEPKALQMGQKGITESKKYDWEKTVNETEKIYLGYVK